MYLHIDSVTCISQDDYTGSDDIFLIIQKGFPRTVNVGEIQAGQTRQLSKDISLEESPYHAIEIWERDSLSPNDLLGTISLENHERNTDQEAVIENGTASYKIWFKIVEESF